MALIPGSRRAAATGLSAAMLALAAACSSAGTGSVAGHGSPAPATSSAPAALSPRQAVLDAAVQTRRVNSAVETLNVQESGTTSSTATGTIQFRLKPTLEADEDLNVSAAGQTTQIKLIVTGAALYFSEPAVASQVGKPWLKIELSALHGTSLANVAQLVQDLQGNDFANQSQMLTAATNTHVVGTQTVEGIPTTEYAGSFRPSAGLKVLPASIRKLLAPELQALGNNVISFQEWIDGQHYLRKLTEVETVNGNVLRTTIIITAINQPVQITLPPAGQTASEPGL